MAYSLKESLAKTNAFVNQLNTNLGSLKRFIAKTVDSWYPDGFSVNATAIEEWDGVVIRGIAVTKVALTANNAYNIFGLPEYAYGSDIFHPGNYGICVGTTGVAQKTAVLQPYTQDTRYMQLYACDDIPIGTTLLFNFKMYFKDSYLANN